MKKVVFCFFLVFCFKGVVFSQVSNDAGLWATFNLEKKINKKFTFFLTEEYRRRENFTRLNLFYTDIGLAYKPFDILKVSLAYRLIEKYEQDNSFSYRHRIMLDITLKKKFSQLVVSFRERLQVENRNIYTSDKGRYPEWYSRNKLKLAYDFNKPITPYIAAEMRYQIVNPRSVEGNYQWSRGRYFIGLDYKRNDRHAFGLYYMIQEEFDISAPQNLYIVGIEYSLSL